MTDGARGDHSGDDSSASAAQTGDSPGTEPGGERRSTGDGDSPVTESATSEHSVPTLGEPTGARLAREQTQTANLDRGAITEYTTDRRSLASTVQIQWAIRVAVLTTVLGLILSAILSTVPVPMQFGLVGIGVLLALGLVWVVMSYRIWVYQIREDSLYLERGVVTHVRTIVPYVRIQHVDTSRSALERALGLSTLVVYTAGSRGADVSVPGLTPDEARDLQQRLKELAIEADGDDAL